MKEQLFDDLVASIKQAGKIHRGEAPPTRTFNYEPDDARQIRRRRKNVTLGADYMIPRHEAKN